MIPTEKKTLLVLVTLVPKEGMAYAYFATAAVAAKLLDNNAARNGVARRGAQRTTRTLGQQTSEEYSNVKDRTGGIHERITRAWGFSFIKKYKIVCV